MAVIVVLYVQKMLLHDPGDMAETTVLCERCHCGILHDVFDDDREHEHEHGHGH